MPSSRPLIGLTTYLEPIHVDVWDLPAAYLPRSYLDGVTRAGGVAVLLPPQPLDDGAAARALDALDGLIVTGGTDADPSLYGAQRHPSTDAPRPDRDAWEDALLKEAIARDLPFLGICRGLQMLNVSLGGTLIQHLPDVVGSDRYSVGGGEFATNEVEIDEESALAAVLGHAGSKTVRSYHHQALDRVASGLSVTARSDDGTVQAVELAGARFGLGVQWHPEEDAEDGRLFAGLVAAASEMRERGRAA